MYSGKRSKESTSRREQKHVAKNFIWEYSFNDYLKSESISRTDPSDVVEHLNDVFGFADMSAVPCTFRGVVISDAYGNGAFQR